jgi:carbonic anhydrase/SulP family sulfate permease
MSERITTQGLLKDLVAGLVVFLVALPLCLGIAHASGAPLLAGLVSGVLAGLVVSWLSGSHTSVSGPAAGLTAVVLHEIQSLQSFEAFLVAVAICGLLQILMGAIRLGFIALFIPSCVISGLLAAIGIILILKQIPHAFGHDPDYEGDFAFFQEDGRNTFSELLATIPQIHPGAALIGVLALVFLVAWDRSPLKKSLIPAPLVVVAFGVALKLLFDRMHLGPRWAIGESHLVQVPVVNSLRGWTEALHLPDLRALGNPRVYVAGLTLAFVASLETLLNLEATDRIDPRRRISPPNRELVAQGVGNILAGLLGGLPMTSVIVRSSVNIHSGAHTRLSAFVHGILLLGSVVLVPMVLNLIPLSTLAAILVMTGLKLASPALFRRMWNEGRSQILPFLATVTAIVLTDLLIGILIGLGVSLFFILANNLRRPFLANNERYVGGEVVRLELGNQVTFLNKAAVTRTLHELPEGSQVVLDAHATDFIDPDVLGFLREFREEIAPTKSIRVGFVGFPPEYGLPDEHPVAPVSTREIQANLTPGEVLEILREGNDRFVADHRIHRSLVQQVDQTAAGQFPIAVVLSCIDSRTSSELIFDAGIGDIFSIRIAGNVAADKVLASIEYASLIAGAKLIVVLGHTGCGAVTAACEAAAGNDAKLLEACPHLNALTMRIGKAIAREAETPAPERTGRNPAFVDRVARLNVDNMLAFINEQCPTLSARIAAGQLGLVGGMYDLHTGRVEFLGAEHLPTHGRPGQRAQREIAATGSAGAG